MNIILGIDTSCDDTGVGIVRTAAGTRPLVLANVVYGQTAIHREFGGIMPEQASREHLTVIDDALTEALATAGVTLNDITEIAVTHGPGLIGSLLVGLTYAKGLAFTLGVPLVPVHHLAGHIASAATTSEPPFLALIASGGHTALYSVAAWDEITELGRTLDDAAGEAFDKVARVLGLGYPGGAALAKLAEDGDAHAVPLPRPLQRRRDIAFSFSGLKTAAAQLFEQQPDTKPADMAASFERVAIDHLITVTLRALQQTGHHTLVVAGGVAANQHLREALNVPGVSVHFPPLTLATDNGAMIALAAALQPRATTQAESFRVPAVPYLPLT